MAAADALTALKRLKRELIERHVRPDDWRGLAAVALTLLPIGLLACAAFLARVSYALTAAQQRRHRHARSIWLAPLAGFLYVVLNPRRTWITANIGYHHVHHLSARIPSYCLAECHDEYGGLFRGVTRMRLGQVPAALKYILWDTTNQRLVSVAELQRRGA